MSPIHMIQTLINAESLHKASLVSLKPGQLLYGRVEQFLPNNTAIIKIGNMRLLSHVRADLSAADSYWLEVQSVNNDRVQLKVVEGNGYSDSADLLLKNFQLPETKLNLQLVQFLLSKNIPFTKEQLQLSAGWLNDQTELPKQLTALEWMMKRDLPFTRLTFQSLVGVQDTHPLHQQLEELGNYLDDPALASLKTIKPLKEMISSIIGNQSIIESTTSNDIKHMLQTLVQSLGLEYEKEVAHSTYGQENSKELLQSLKPLLISAAQELGSNKHLEPVLNRLTGMQLLSLDQIKPIQQMVFQLPISIGEMKSDVTIQWSGRKTSKGQIDPDYCRILFYLDLQSIKQTVIDMHIQNKVIHVNVINEKKEIEHIFEMFTPILKEKLKSIGYKLSLIKVIPSFEKKEQQPMNLIHLSSEFYQKVDIKI